MDWEEHRIQSAGDFPATLAECSRLYGYVFRGQSRASPDWELVPRLDRLVGDLSDRRKIATWEATAISCFRRYSRVHLSEPSAAFMRTVLGSLTLMQHYGAPTRLLDWTFSPWVAAYFASIDHPDEDGVIWMFDRDHLSRTTRFGLPASDHEALAAFNSLTASEQTVEWAKWSAQQIPAFTTFVYEFADARISAQQSIFTIAGTLGVKHSDELARLVPNDKRFRIIIPANVKQDLVLLLWRMNVGPLSLFPGIDGVGKFLIDAIRSHLPLEDGGVAWMLRETDDGKELGLS